MRPGRRQPQYYPVSPVRFQNFLRNLAAQGVRILRRPGVNPFGSVYQAAGCQCAYLMQRPGPLPRGSRERRAPREKFDRADGEPTVLRQVSV